jgi:hypothetical protein
VSHTTITFFVLAVVVVFGVTAWAGEQLIARVGESRTRLLVLMSLLVAAQPALISVNGAVAAPRSMVILLVTGAVPPVVAGLLAGGRSSSAAYWRSSGPTAASPGRRSCWSPG